LFTLNSEIKTLLLKMAIHVILLVVTIAVIEHYIRIADNDEMKYSYEAMFSGSKANSIIIGASHATVGINPKYISIDKFYNFAMYGANPSFTLIWYKDIFRKHHNKPKIIVYEVNWFMFDSEWLWRRIDRDALYLPTPVILDLLADKNIAIIDKIRILKSNLILEGGILKPPTVSTNDTSKYNGFVPKRLKKFKEYETFKCAYDEKQVADFISLIRLILEDKSLLIFVQAPEYFPGRESICMQNQNELIKGIAETYQVPFFNYNGERVSAINYNKNLYADWGHLNLDGSTRFSKLLAKDFQALPTRYHSNNNCLSTKQASRDLPGLD